MGDYDFEIERIVEKINSSGAKTVGLQFPEGLKGYAVDLAEKIELGSYAKVVIFADPTYGACDTKDSQAEKLGLDLLVHFGHTDFL